VIGFLNAATRRLRLPAIVGALALLAGCATPPSDPAALADFKATNDPLEPMNRSIFEVNQFLDRALIKPLALGYRFVFPQFSRDMVRHFLDNLGEPVIFANNVLQGEWKLANDTAARFFVNSTFGLGGVIDLASMTELPRQSGDFGQTLYAWGISDGPYLVLPILGPSNPRDTTGMVVDGIADPWGYLADAYGAAVVAGISRFAAKGIDERERNIETVDELQRNAIDFYAQLRSLSRQHRASELRHGRPAPMPNLDSLVDPAKVEDAAIPH
jgi:phospholipid-binding lipoprotein MlaA